MRNIQIEVAKPEDAEQINEVFYQTWLATYPNKEIGITKEDVEDRFNDRKSKEKIEKRRDEILNDKNATLLVARQGDNIIGVCRMERLEAKNRLRAVYVLPEFQGMGMGKLLWQEAQKCTNPAKDTFVEVATYNTKAINFYKHLGFKDTGRRFEDERFRMKGGTAIPEMEMVIRAQGK
ncbi:MAG TPA: GNAT family N-acetyltransferase [Negativicutes bacterium]|nr:GNAT family N-acetyltransferase [Negativicutes bacterium]